MKVIITFLNLYILFYQIFVLYKYKSTEAKIKGTLQTIRTQNSHLIIILYY